MTYEQARLKRHLTVRVICTVLGALLLVPILPAHAQQVVAGPGDDIDVSGQTVTTSGVPALNAHDGGRIFNSPGPGNGVTINTSGAQGALATSGGIIHLDGGGTITTNGFAAVGLATNAGGTITSSATISTVGIEGTGAFANGGAITITGGSITTAGDTAYGAYAQGGLITLHAGVVVTTMGGAGAHGLVARGGGMIISAASVSTTKDTAFGVYAGGPGGPGTINLTGGSVTTGGNQAFGLYAEGAGSSITSAINVTTGGQNAPGAYANGGTIILTGGVITTNGSPAAGLQALNGGSITSVADVVTHGAASRGVEAGGGGTVILNGGSVTTTNGASHGLFIETSGGTITSVVNVTTSGDSAIGAFAGGGTITLNGGTITTTGTASHGLEARETGIVSATGVTVTVSGPLAAGIAVVDGGTLTLTNSTAVSVQDLALASQARTGLTNTYVITGSKLSSLTNLAMAFQGGTHNVTLENSQVAGGNGQLVQVATRTFVPPDPTPPTPTQLALTASGSTLTGDMQVVDPGTNTANVMLNQGTVWTGASLDLTNLALSGATWNVTGSSTITDTLTNGGDIAFQWDGAFHTLTTTNYVGNGGTINFNAALAGDASPSDKLIIDGGSATGMTGIIVANQGGPGAQTTGNGIPLVLPTGGATIGAGTFSLAAPVAAGPFQYLLFQGTSSGGGSSAEEQTYYLRSHLDDDTPIFRGEVALYSALASTARQQSLTALGTFHDRNGDQRLAGAAGQRTAAWGRLFGQHIEQSHSGGVAAHFDGNTGGLQAGADIAQWVSRSGHQDRFGLFAAYARSTGDVGGAVLGLPDTRAGRIELDGTSAGGYWTHLAPSGWYTDAVLMATRFDTDARSTFGTDVSVSGYGFQASLEGGYPIAIARGVWLEPQAQLVYQHLNLDDVNDPYAHVGFDTPDALFGRLGLRLSADMLPLPMVLRPYLQANIWQDFTDTDTIRFSGVHAIHSRHEATTLELGGGVVAQLSSNVGLWINAGYMTDIGGSDDEVESIRGTAGLRVTW